MFAAEVIVAGFAFLGLRIGPAQRHFFFLRCVHGGLDVVFDERDFLKGHGAGELQRDRGGAFDGEFVAHHVLGAVGGFAAAVGDDVVRCAVSMTLAHGIDDAFAARILGINHGVADVRAAVVAAALKAELVAFGEGVRHPTAGLPAADGVVLGGASRAAGVFVVLAGTLINFDHWFELAAPVPPVGAHVADAGVAGADAAELLEVFIEHECVWRWLMHATITDGQARKRAHAALSEDDIAMSFGITHAAFVAEHRREVSGQHEGICGLLREPPGVLAAIAVIVIATAEPVHGCGIDGVAPHVLQRAVAAAVSADLGVAMEFSAQDAQFFARDIRTITANACNLSALSLGALAERSVGTWQHCERLQRGCFDIAAENEAAEIDIVVEGVLARIQCGVAAFAAGCL